MEEPVLEDRLRLGQRIRDLRADAGWTQSQLARALGMSFQQVQRYEHVITRVSVAALLKILAVLGVPPAAFFQSLNRPLGLPVPVPIIDPGLEQFKSDYERSRIPTPGGCIGRWRGRRATAFR